MIFIQYAKDYLIYRKIYLQFSGTWYVVRRRSDLLLNGDCGSINIQSISESFYFTNDVVNNNFAESISGTVTQENETAKLTLKRDDNDQGEQFLYI